MLRKESVILIKDNPNDKTLTDYYHFGSDPLSSVIAVVILTQITLKSCSSTPSDYDVVIIHFTEQL